MIFKSCQFFLFSSRSPASLYESERPGPTQAEETTATTESRRFPGFENANSRGSAASPRTKGMYVT